MMYFIKVRYTKNLISQCDSSQWYVFQAYAKHLATAETGINTKRTYLQLQRSTCPSKAKIMQMLYNEDSSVAFNIMLTSTIG